MIALCASVSHFAVCPDNLPVLQAMGHAATFQVRKEQKESQRVNLDMIFRCLEHRKPLKKHFCREGAVK